MTLPVGMGLNPSAANGLQTCTDAQFGKGTTNPVACPAGVEDRHGRDRDRRRCPTASLERQRLRRPAAQPRPDLGRRVPDLRRRRVGPLRDLGAADRQRQRQPADRAADDDLRRNPAGPVQLLRAQLRRRRREPSLTSPPTCGPNTTTTQMTPWSGNPAGDARRTSFTLTTAPGGGACAKTLAARPFAPGFAAKPQEHQGRRLQPVRGAHRPQRRPAGAERRRRHPAAGADRQAGRRPLLPGGGARRRGRAAAAPPRRPTRAAPRRA